MLRKTTVLFILLMILVIAFPGSTAANDVTIALEPPARNQRTVSSNDYLWAQFKWPAGTPGLVQDAISRMRLQLILDGQTLVASPEAKAYWGEIQPAQPPPFWHTWNDHLPWAESAWRYPIGTLTPGTHHLEFHASVDGTIAVLSDNNLDGYADIVDDWHVDKLVTIFVQ